MNPTRKELYRALAAQNRIEVFHYAMERSRKIREGQHMETPPANTEKSEGVSIV